VIFSVSQFQTLSKISRDVRYGNGTMFFLITLPVALLYNSRSTSNLLVVTVAKGEDY
jgi:hypothetical protein